MDDITVVYLVGRIFERLLLASSGLASLAMGWNLFRRGVVGEQHAEFQHASTQLKLLKVGPGVFFGLFGAIILTASIIRPFKIEWSQGPSEKDASLETTFSGSAGPGGTSDRLKPWCQSLNSSRVLLKVFGDLEESSSYTEEIERAQAWLDAMRATFLGQRFTEDQLAEYKRIKGKPPNLRTVSESEHFKKMEPYVDERLSNL